MKGSCWLLLVFLTGCTRVSVFSSQSLYSIAEDPFYDVYSRELVSIAGKSYDSEQVSNKHLDAEFVVAMDKLNELLSHPEQASPDLREDLRSLGMQKVQLASASRSPWHQASLVRSYKASYLDSFHLLGLAGDMVMKGTPVDVYRSKDQRTLLRYKSLARALKSCGLVFSEPIDKDPNHIELFKYSKLNKNARSHHASLWTKEKNLMVAFKKSLLKDHGNFLFRSSHERLMHRRRIMLLLDLDRRLSELEQKLESMPAQESMP